MNADTLSTAAWAVVDKIKWLGEQSAFFQISSHAVYRMVREVLQFWEEHGLRDRFMSTVGEEELDLLVDETASKIDHALRDLCSLLNATFELRRKPE